MRGSCLSGIFIVLLLAGCGGGSGGGGGGGEDESDTTPLPSGTSTEVRVFAANDLGMHCIDREFSVYSILPLFNVIHAQVVMRGDGRSPQLRSDLLVTYEAVRDPGGSINSTSLSGKSDFWTHVQNLYGATLNPGESLTGRYMPADAPTPGPQPMRYDAATGMFVADGLPITDTDDAGQGNPYPLLRIRVRDPNTNDLLAEADVVVPVSSETDCQSCHATGAIGASGSTVTWSQSTDPEVQAKENVLLLHDSRIGTSLFASQPVLCASCHYSLALDLNGTGPTAQQSSKPPFSRAMHAFHGRLTGASGQPLLPPGGTARETCYQCHPGRVTECQRGAMKTGGMECYDCHGDTQDVGGEDVLAAGGSLDGTNDGGRRRAWTDLPRCQSCHTGDALDHLTGAGLAFAADGIRLRQAWRTGDPAASPIQAAGSRFAENAGTLFRMSRGHGGLLCTSCHGSPHAIWPNADPTASDNLLAVAQQGHAGTISECSVCHVPGSLAMTTRGPHGMHNVGDRRWTDHEHEDFFERDADSCKACHGQDLLGTALSRTATDRVLLGRNVPAGTPIGCTLCHDLPEEEDEED